MTNHPNRNWRARAHQAAATFVAEHSILWKFLPSDHASLQHRLRESYEAGFAAGREDAKPRPSNDA